MPDQVDLKEKTETKNSNDFDHDKLPSASAKEQETQDNGDWETQLFQVYNGSASLKYPHLEPGDVTAQYTLEPSRLPLQEGVAAMPDAARVSAYDTEGRKGVVFTALGGRVELAISNFRQAKAEAQLATMNIVSDQTSGLADKQQAETITDQTAAQTETDDTEISAYLRDTVVIEPIEGLRIELGQGEYIKNKNDQNPKLRFWQTRLVFEAQNQAEDFVTELDRTGLHTSEGQNVHPDDSTTGGILAASVLEVLNEGREQKPEPIEAVEEKAVVEEKPQEERSQEEQLKEEQPQEVSLKEEQPQEVQEQPQAVASQAEQITEEWKEFKPGDLTDDGFVKMEEAEYKLKKVGGILNEQYGKAKFRFMEIPYTIPLFNEKEFKGKTKSKEPDQDMQIFTVGPSGKLRVEFEKPIELSLIGNEKIEQYLVATIRLEGASIENSLLTAEKIRIDLGVAPRPDKEEAQNQPAEESEDKGILKKLFGENISGSYAYISDVDHIDKGGIYAASGKKSLGAFGVSKFLGFLDVEGDYPSGQLKVGFEDQKEKGMSDIFDEKATNIFGDGINIPIVGPLAFKVSISPSVSIGGSFSASLDRGKSFGEPMESGESMDMSGEIGIEGKGKLDMAAGLALTPGILSSVSIDLKVGSELSAGIKASAQAETALGLRDEKLKQTKDLNLDGGVEIDLQGKVSVSSDVHVFIWNARLFEVTLCEKEVSLQPFQGHASRDKDAEGLKQGWHFESMGLSAKGLGQKTVEAMRNSSDLKQVREEKLQMSKEAAESLGKEVESAWTLLEELNRENELAKGRAYLTTKEEKTALNDRIKKLSKEVNDKISDYVAALEYYKIQLYGKEEDSQKEVKKAREERFRCLERDSIRQIALQDIQKGGFLFEKYLPMTEEESKGKFQFMINRENERRNKMAAIDFTIARALGIYSKAYEKERDAYDLFAKRENLKRQIEKRQGKASTEGEYTLSKDMTEDNFLYSEKSGWGAPASNLRSATKYGLKPEDNYFNAISGNVTCKFVGSTYKKFFLRKNSQGKVVELEGMKTYDFLQNLMLGVYPKGACDEKGNSIEGQKVDNIDAADKTKLYKKLYKNTLSAEDKRMDYISRVLDGKDYKKKKTQREYMMEDINKVLQELFGSNLDEMVAKGNVNMSEKLKELDDNLETSKTKYLKAVENHYEVENAVKKVEAEQTACEWKLIELKSKINKGLELKPESVAAANFAVNFIQKDYADVANGVTMVKDAVNGIDADSDVYKKFGEIEKKVFPERENAAKALKASVAV